MPFKNEHAARQTDPSKYVRFRREKDKFGSGRDAIWGVKSDGTVELQSIRFKSSQHSVAAAKKWLRSHGKKTGGFEVATGGDTEKVLKHSFERSFEVAKVNEEERLVFGWASVSEKGGELIVDSDEEAIDTDALEKAAYDFILNAGVGSDMHKVRQVAVPVESMFFSKAKQEALGIDLGRIGWWVGFRVQDDDVWKMIKSGERPMFSIGGKAKRRAA